MSLFKARTNNSIAKFSDAKLSEPVEGILTYYFLIFQNNVPLILANFLSRCLYSLVGPDS